MITFLFFFNDTATTEIYTLSLHDALPIFLLQRPEAAVQGQPEAPPGGPARHRSRCDGQGRRRRHRRGELLRPDRGYPRRSEEHTSELQSRQYLVCRLLLVKQIVRI